MDQPGNVPAPLPAAPRGGGRGAWAALLLAVLAIGACGWLWVALQQIHGAQQALEQSLARVSASVPPPRDPELERRVLDSSQALETLQAHTKAQDEALRTLQSALAEREQRVDLPLAEAEYLLRLASQSLLMGREVRGAIALLEAADSALRDHDDPALHPARELLARDLVALRAIAALDVEGLYLRLAALSATVPLLRVEKLHLPPAEPGVASGEQAEGWLGRARALLERFVVIRHDDAPRQTAQLAAGEDLARMSIRLSLEQAKLALLAGEQGVYAGALADADGQLRGGFDLHAAENRAFLAELSRLAGERVAPDLPDLSEALRALREAAQTQRAEG